MKRSLYSFACVLGLASVGWADVTTFTASNGDWNNPNNWDNGIPTAEDRAMIPANKVCTIPENYAAVADTIEVEADGELHILRNATLTLDNSGDNEPTDPDHSQVDGLVSIVQTAKIIFVDNGHAVHGDGKIEGLHVDAIIEIEADIDFTNRLGDADGGVKGSMTIKGLTGGTTNGKFNNEGLVHATTQIVLHADTVLDDHNTVNHATWKATGDGLLEFNRKATNLNGRFFLACTQITINQNIKTCGEFRFNQGTLAVASGKTFKFVTFATDTSCSNPGVEGNTRPPTCGDPYVVSSSASCGATCGSGE